MNRRNFITTSVTSSALLLLFPLRSAMAEESCLRALEGVDVESNEAIGFSHYHQLIIPISDFVNPPKNGIQLTTSVMDQGSYDAEGMENFARNENIDLEALRGHDHVVRISQNELKRIAKGEKNVEITVYRRDGKTYAHNFLVTAPPSLLAIVKKERKK